MANGNTLRHLLETRGRGREGERREGERVRGREGERREGEGQDGERAGVWNWKGHPHPTPYTLHPSPYTHTLHPTSPAGDERERARGREGERREGERVRGREGERREGEGQDGERAGVWNWKGHPHPTPYTLHPSPYTHTLHPTSPAGDERERARGREGERREGERVRGRELMKRTCARHVPRR